MIQEKKRKERDRQREKRKRCNYFEDGSTRELYNKIVGCKFMKWYFFAGRKNKQTYEAFFTFCDYHFTKKVSQQLLLKSLQKAKEPRRRNEPEIE